jgi:uncharacterized protein (TIGR02145 family)
MDEVRISELELAKEQVLCNIIFVDYTGYHLNAVLYGLMAEETYLEHCYFLHALNKLVRNYRYANGKFFLGALEVTEEEIMKVIDYVHHYATERSIWAVKNCNCGTTVRNVDIVNPFPSGSSNSGDDSLLNDGNDGKDGQNGTDGTNGTTTVVNTPGDCVDIFKQIMANISKSHYVPTSLGCRLVEVHLNGNLIPDSQYSYNSTTYTFLYFGDINIEDGDWFALHFVCGCTAYTEQNTCEFGDGTATTIVETCTWGLIDVSVVKSVNVGAPPVIDNLSLPKLGSENSREITLSSNVSTDSGYPLTARGILYGLTCDLTLSSDKILLQNIPGTKVGVITGLTPGTSYYVAAYATNSNGTTIYPFPQKVTIPLPPPQGNEDVMISTYGRLYNWYAANDPRHIAAEGWRVPSEEDFDSLITCIDPLGNFMNNEAGMALKESGTQHWASPNTGTNTTGFNARGSGNIYDVDKIVTNITDLTTVCFFIVSDDINNQSAYVLRNDINIFDRCASAKYFGHSIRLVRNSSQPNGTVGTYIGNDGTSYGTIVICGKEWLSQNLAETVFRDGITPIPFYLDHTIFISKGISTLPASTVFKLNLTTETDVSSPDYVSPIAKEYGFLYNLHTIKGTKAICSGLWHVPTKADWNEMMVHLGDFPASSGGKLKETGTVHWLTPNTEATDVVNFRGRPGGCRLPDGSFLDVRLESYWMVQPTVNDSTTLVCISYNNAYTGAASHVYTYGFNIRLVKTIQTIGTDGTIIPNGYIGNDGKGYDTVIINNREWLQSNLLETEFTDHTKIPEVISNSDWAALTTPARCSYKV